MTVLPYHVNRFIRRNLNWNNIRFQWSVVGFAAFLIAVAAGYAVGHFVSIWWAGTVVSTTFAAVLAAPFLYAAIELPMPLQEPWIVKKYGDLGRWWAKMSRPASSGTLNGNPVLERWVLTDFAEVYNRDGQLIGHKQEFEKDPYAYEEGSGRYTSHFTPTEKAEQKRLPWLARLRSPKLPVDLQAEVATNDGHSVGYTTYKSS